eukprot:TRINITY_DN2918_c0_g1_i1.p1 TRINITY_DN2918_c0_g1~~TRINITY_DN2918_c0_g1_i1.p1  ORF type:complete len:392 (-),score=108.17 TRINITY_DN2918_c0_g1_i1:118-1293(-)
MALEPEEGDQEQTGEAVITKEEFYRNFKAEEKSLKEELASIVAAGSGNNVDKALDAVLAREQILEASFTRSAHLLPAYDVQQYRSACKAITEEIAAKRELLAPRKKFSFKRKEKAAEPSPTAASDASGYGSSGSSPPVAATTATTTITTATTTAQLPTAPKAEALSSPAAATESQFNGELFEDLRETSIERGVGELQGRDVSLKNLEGCRIVLLDHIGALHVRNLRRCEVIVGAVKSSALMHHCHECVFTLAVKQLRLHDSEKVVLHLHTLSQPVIEHSKRIMFAPFDLLSTENAGQLKTAELGVTSESGPWSDVQDFNWLRRQASPNWCQVPANLRRTPLSLPASAVTLPPALPELEKYRSCWEAAEAAVAPSTTAAVPTSVQDAHDDEF